jgi:hypothetical protein
MGNNKVKTDGQLQGKGAKGKKDLHPKSRKVQQTARVGLRTKRINETKKERNRVEEDKSTIRLADIQSFSLTCIQSTAFSGLSRRWTTIELA